MKSPFMGISYDDTTIAIDEATILEITSNSIHSCNLSNCEVARRNVHFVKFDSFCEIFIL